MRRSAFEGFVGDVSDDLMLTGSLSDVCSTFCFEEGPKPIYELEQHADWILMFRDQLHAYERTMSSFISRRCSS